MTPIKCLTIEKHGIVSLYQKEILNKTFTNWHKGHRQIDDVLVIGIKI